MTDLISFQERVFYANSSNFEELTLEIFRFQVGYNNVYKDYVNSLGINPEDVKTLEMIPFLPIEFFRTHQVISGGWEAKSFFESSGTTQIDKKESGNSVQSKHFVFDPEFISRITIAIFEQQYGSLSEFHILALLPSYLERKNASLVHMVDGFIRETGSDYSGFYLNEFDSLADRIKNLSDSGNRKILLIGVSFALLDFIDTHEFENLDRLIVMETGGMKGRRKELIRDELHGRLKSGFGVSEIHSEYGMTELTSQAYAISSGEFVSPPWMKFLIRDINDPFSFLSNGRNGGINIIDLANVSTCSFIETKDLGRMNTNGKFEVLGRFDNADIRGCNLMIT